MKEISLCICNNYNCDVGESLAEPYSHCSCGYIFEPINEWETMGHIDEEETFNG